MTTSKKKVIIVQRRLTHYRVPFFIALKQLLNDRNIELVLLVGEGTKDEKVKQDSGTIQWATKVKTFYFTERLCLQLLGPHLADADLVVIPQENRLLFNYSLLLRRRPCKIAYWGHGANFQSTAPRGLRERLKRRLATRVDWWFAYTDVSVKRIEAAGFPKGAITVVNNATDTSELARHLSTIDAAETSELQRRLGLRRGEVGIFIGSLYTEKRIDFLFQAADLIRREVPNFSLIIVGDGPERWKVKRWCEDRPWACWMGALTGREKAACMAAAQVMLNPGLVGLGILDSFVGLLPMLTTDCGLHSPEIAYLSHGTNGLMCRDDLSEYSGAAVKLLRNQQLLKALSRGCFHSSREYTIEKMADRFARGIFQALDGSTGHVLVRDADTSSS